MAILVNKQSQEAAMYFVEWEERDRFGREPIRRLAYFSTSTLTKEWMEKVVEFGAKIIEFGVSSIVVNDTAVHEDVDDIILQDKAQFIR